MAYIPGCLYSCITASLYKYRLMDRGQGGGAGGPGPWDLWLSLSKHHENFFFLTES